MVSSSTEKVRASAHTASTRYTKARLIARPWGNRPDDRSRARRPASRHMPWLGRRRRNRYASTSLPAQWTLRWLLEHHQECVVDDARPARRTRTAHRARHGHAVQPVSYTHLT